MKYVNKTYFILWITLLVISYLVIPVYESVAKVDEAKLMELCEVTPREYKIYKKSPPPTCWDGIDVDEEKLKELCNVSPKEYKEKLRTDKGFCPEGDEAFLPVGGCYAEPFCPESEQAFEQAIVIRWKIAILVFIIVSVAYNLIYFLVRKK